MKKQILNLGTVLSKDEQLEILGGHRDYFKKVDEGDVEGGCGYALNNPGGEFDVYQPGGGGNGVDFIC